MKSLKGRKLSDTRRKQISIVNRSSEESVRNKISEGVKKYLSKLSKEEIIARYTIEVRKKISKALKNKKRQSLTKEHKIKIGEKVKGNKNGRWLNGKSYEKYTLDWTNSLRISIRERDKYICQICHEKQGDIAFDVHHIDYDKKNNDIMNLISLCKRCHMKTNTNREYWENYLKVEQLKKQ